MTATPQIVPSIVKTVDVPLDRESAFSLFTNGIGTWWPLDTHSVGGATSRGVTLSETGLVEVLSDGSTTSWGEVVEWLPPAKVVVTWHPGEEAGPDQTHVAVSFEATSTGTRVRLEHSGWERIEPQRRTNYDTGWDVVLAHFVRAA